MFCTRDEVFAESRWQLRSLDIYAAAMYCRSATDEQWLRARMDIFPSGATEFCDIVTQEVLRDLDIDSIQDMCKGFACTL